MLKNQLVGFYKEIMKENSFTYKELTRLTKLSPPQIASILKHDADIVSIEKMEKGLNALGFGLEVTPSYLEEIK